MGTHQLRYKLSRVEAAAAYAGAVAAYAGAAAAYAGAAAAYAGAAAAYAGATAAYDVTVKIRLTQPQVELEALAELGNFLKSNDVLKIIGGLVGNGHTWYEVGGIQNTDTFIGY